MPHNQTDTLRVSTLVSIGAHPDTGRARRSATDARAVELAMNLEGCELEVLHAGNPQDPALGYYSGMGLSQIRVLSQDEQDDAVNTLSSYFRDDMPDIVLTGMRAENGESSGTLPFFLLKSWVARLLWASQKFCLSKMVQHAYCKRYHEDNAERLMFLCHLLPVWISPLKSHDKVLLVAHVVVKSSQKRSMVNN